MVVNALEKLALKNALSNSLSDLVRRAYKHYSTTYHTPLYLAQQFVTEYEAILTYFEDRFENMDPIALKDMVDVMYPKKNLALINDSAAFESQAQVMADDEAWVTQMNMKLQQKETAEAAKKEANEVMAAVDQAIAEINKSLQSITEKADTDA